MSDAILRFLARACVLLVPALGPATAEAQFFPPNEELEVMLRYLVEDGLTPGIVLGILEDDGSTRTISYGTGGPGTRPLGAQSVFETGSVNKTFTATLLADLVAQGKVALEDPVAKYLPAEVRVPSLAGREITLLDLATHRSGLPKSVDNHQPADPQSPYADFTMETIYAFLASHELRREPGAGFEYSNLGFQLLGHALGRAAGMSYSELHRQRILEPLGMTATGPTHEGETAGWITQGHRSGAAVTSLMGAEASLGAGSYLSTVEDLLLYLKANVGLPGSELEQAMKVAQEVRAAWGEGSGNIGLAWRSDTVQGRLIVEHGGNTAGFTSLIAFDPERRVGIVMLANTFAYPDRTPIDLLAFGPHKATPEAWLEPEAMTSLTGEYVYPSGQALHVRMESEGHLTAQRERRARFRLFAESDTAFISDRGSPRLIFIRGDDGEVSGVRLEPGPSGEIARRVGAESPSPRSVAAGTEWERIGIEWEDGYWALVAGLSLLAMLTLGAELRRISTRRSKQGS